MTHWPSLFHRKKEAALQLNVLWIRNKCKLFCIEWHVYVCFSLLFLWRTNDSEIKLFSSRLMMFRRLSVWNFAWVFRNFSARVIVAELIIFQILNSWVWVFLVEFMMSKSMVVCVYLWRVYVKHNGSGCSDFVYSWFGLQ